MFGSVLQSAHLFSLPMSHVFETTIRPQDGAYRRKYSWAPQCQSVFFSVLPSQLLVSKFQSSARVFTQLIRLIAGIREDC